MEKSLENIKVNSPCSQDWEKMQGNNQIKFCSSCKKNVYNISEMTQKRALKVINQENVCVRFHQEENGKLVLQNNFSYFRRKLFSIAAAIFMGILSFTSINAFSDNPNKKPKKKKIIKKHKRTVEKHIIMGGDISGKAKEPTFVEIPPDKPPLPPKPPIIKD